MNTIAFDIADSALDDDSEYKASVPRSMGAI